MASLKRVYISGPITKGCRSHNVYQSYVAEQRLLEAGFAVYNPMACIQRPFWAGIKLEYEGWLAQDFAWIQVSHAILLLPGESTGAVRECDYAAGLEIPIYTDIEELIRDLRPRG